MAESSGMTYVGLRLPHHILKRAYRRSRKKRVDHDRDRRLWELADSWVQRTLSKDDLSVEELEDSDFSLLDVLRAIDDIHGREIAADVYEYVDDIEEGDEEKCEWVLDPRHESGFHLVNYHDWVMDALTKVEENKDLHVDDDIDEHFGVADVTLCLEGRETGPVQICVTLWSDAVELPKRAIGSKFTRCDFKDVSPIVKANKRKLSVFLDILQITEEEVPRNLEIFTGATVC